MKGCNLSKAGARGVTLTPPEVFAGVDPYKAGGAAGRAARAGVDDPSTARTRVGAGLKGPGVHYSVFASIN